jgi:hypothetical protein
MLNAQKQPINESVNHVPQHWPPPHGQPPLQPRISVPVYAGDYATRLPQLALVTAGSPKTPPGYNTSWLKIRLQTTNQWASPEFSLFLDV